METSGRKKEKLVHLVKVNPGLSPRQFPSSVFMVSSSEELKVNEKCTVP